MHHRSQSTSKVLELQSSQKTNSPVTKPATRHKHSLSSSNINVTPNVVSKNHPTQNLPDLSSVVKKPSQIIALKNKSTAINSSKIKNSSKINQLKPPLRTTNSSLPKNPSPNPRRTPSPNPRRTPSPNPRRSPSPNPRRSPTHHPQRTSSPSLVKTCVDTPLRVMAKSGSFPDIGGIRREAIPFDVWFACYRSKHGNVSEGSISFEERHALPSSVCKWAHCHHRLNSFHYGVN